MKYIICGIEHIGVRVVDFLHSQGEEIVAVTLDGNEPHLKEIQHKATLCIVGDARIEETLVKAGVHEADVLMALTSNDVKNFEISSIARKANSHLRIVTRLSSENVHQDIEKVFDIDRALSSTSLAAPSFVSACLGGALDHSFLYRDALWFIGKNNILQSLSQGIEGGCEAKAVKLTTTGDGGLFLSNDRNLLKSLQKSFNASLPKQDRGNDVGRRFVENVRKAVPKGIGIVFLAYLMLIAVSTAVFCIGLNYSFVDALYFVVTTTTTVGFGDFNLRDAAWGYKVFDCFLMLAGAAFLAVLYSVVTDFFIGKRVEKLFGFGRSRYKGHIIVAGLGRIGSRLVNLLLEHGFKVVVVERSADSEYVQNLRGQVPIITGDAQQPAVLARAGVQDAGVIAAVTEDDLINTNIVLQSKHFNRSIRAVARIFNKNIEGKLRQVEKFDYVLSSSVIAAPVFIASALWSKIVTAFYCNNALYVVFECDMNDFPGLKALSPGELLKQHQIQWLASVDNGGNVMLAADAQAGFGEAASLVCGGSYSSVMGFVKGRA